MKEQKKGALKLLEDLCYHLHLLSGPLGRPSPQTGWFSHSGTSRTTSAGWTECISQLLCHCWQWVPCNKIKEKIWSGGPIGVQWEQVLTRWDIMEPSYAEQELLGWDIYLDLSINTASSPGRARVWNDQAFYTVLLGPGYSYPFVCTLFLWPARGILPYSNPNLKAYKIVK